MNDTDHHNLSLSGNKRSHELKNNTCWPGKYSFHEMCLSCHAFVKLSSFTVIVIILHPTVVVLRFYMAYPDMFSYLGLKFQVNRSSEKHRNTSQHRLYEFCYLLPFDLWTSYLARILFLQGCGNWFWKFSSLARIFNGQQYSFHVWYGLHFNVESLWCMKKIILSLL